MALIKDKPVNVIPFWLYDISPFIDRDYPNYIPGSTEYTEYWTERLDRCISGHWGLDNDERNLGGYRWMPGNLYFYTNYTQILQERIGEPEREDFPVLRDIDWYVMYALNVCDGFSGFDGDEEYTSFSVVKKQEEGGRLTNIEKIQLNQYAKYITKKNGKLKKYVDPREYLYKTHKKPLGSPLYHNPCINFMLLSSRAIGKSYLIGGDMSHSFMFNGARSTFDYFENKQSTTVVVGAAVSDKSAELLSKFNSNYEFNRSSVGSYKTDSGVINGAFWAPSAGSTELGKTLTKRVKLEGGKAYSGNHTKIVHVSFKANNSAGVGYRARRIIVEEVGLLGSFHAVQAENNGSQTRETKIGFSIFIGTGGDIEKIRQVRETFNAPEAFTILPYEDIFNNNGKNIGMFIPCYYRKTAYKDKNGNTDIQSAFEDELEERNRIKALDPKAYQGHIISFPFYPQEMFMQDSGGTFPAARLENNLSRLENSDLKNKYSVGTLSYANSSQTSCIWEEDTSGKLKPYLRYSDLHDKLRTDRKGGIVIFEHPVDYKPDRFSPTPLYLTIYDPVEAEDGGGTSYCVVTVFKLWDLDSPNKIQFNIVAEWIGRFERLESNHEVAFKLAAYYSSKLFAEINKSDIIRYARMTNRYHWLEEKPSLALEGSVKIRTEYEVGFKVLTGVKPDWEVYTNELLMTEIDRNEKIYDDALVVDKTYMVDQIPSIMATEQLLNYNRDENFDYVSAFFGIALWVRQRSLKPIRYEAISQSIAESDSLKSFLTKDLSKKQDRRQNPAFNY